MAEDAFGLVAPEFKDAGQKGSYGWDLLWTDNLKHASEHRPVVNQEHSDSKQGADARKEHLFSQREVVACVRQTPPPVATSKQPKQRLQGTHLTR